MKAYESYKPSDVEWLGDVPAQWVVKKVKHIAQFSTGWTPPTGNAASYIGTNYWANIGDLGKPVIEETINFISDEAANVAGIDLSPVGSLLFSFKLSVGQVSVASVPLYTNEAIATFPPQDGFITAWAYYAFPLLIPENSATNIYGAQLLNQQRINDALLVVPKLNEQQAIADYLDVETVRIDGLIEAKHELIKLLVEYRQSVISDAVLQGLDSNVPLKPSGVEWLGDVPAHWLIKKVKYLAELVSEKTDSPIAGQRYIGLEHVETKTGRFIENTEGMQTEAESTVNLFNKGCVLFGKLRPYLAKAVVADTDGVCSSEFLVFSPSGMDAQFLKRCMLLDGFIKTVDASTFGAKMPRADWTFISQLNLPQPPLDEQQAISRHLDVETSKFDTLIRHAEKEIDLLKELRASTIADAILGRVKVI